jgi:hypothetical protein
MSSKNGGKLNKAQTSLLIVSSALFLAYFVPILRWPMLPLQYLYTHLHEIGHALAAVATGGEGVRIYVHADGSGVTSAFGGSQLLVSPAGYIGATAMGALLLAFSRTVVGAQRAFQGMFFLMFIAMVAWIRIGSEGLVGFATGLLFALGFAWLGFRKADGHTQWIAQFLGVFLSLSAIRAVLITLHIGGVAVGEDDAMILQRTTGIPAVLSAFVWTAISLGIAWLGLRRAWSEK